MTAICLRVVNGTAEAYALHWRLGYSMYLLRRSDVEELKHRRGDVHDVRILAADLASGLNSFRPVDDAGVSHAALVYLPLPALEGRVAGPGPAEGVMIVGPGGTEIIHSGEALPDGLREAVEEGGLIKGAVGPAFGTGAVVRDDDDNRVIEFPQLFDEVD